MYNKNENIINGIKNENMFLKNELSNFKNNSNPKNIKFSQEIINDSHSRCFLDNIFIVFKSINNLFHLILANKNKTIISYDLINNEKIREITVI